MKVLLLIIALIVAFILYVLFTETKVEIKYKDKKLCLSSKNGFLKIKLYPKTDKNKAKSVKGQDEKSEAERKIDGVKKKYKEYKELINIFLRTMRHRIKISKFDIGLEFGTGNAATTGILYGVIWGLVTGTFNTLKLFFNIDFPKTEIVPDFQNSKFDFTFNGILRVRLVHIINTLIKIYFRSKKLK